MSYPLQVAKIKAKRKPIEEDGPVPEDGYLYKYRSLKKGPERKNTLAIHCHQTTGGQYIDAGLLDIVELPRGE